MDDILPPVARSRAAPARALAATMLVYTLLGVLAVTLAPFEFRAPTEISVAWRPSDLFELTVNCAMLVVPGFLYRAVTGPTRDVYCIIPAVIALCFAGTIECVQLFIPGRCLSALDIVTNAGGAWLGAMLYDSIRRNVAARLADRLLLELPLTGLLYLLVPMLWLDGFAAVGHARRLALALPLGMIGAIVVASLWMHRLRPAGLLGPNRAAAAAAAWFVVAAAPALRHDPGELAALAVAVFAAARAAIAWPGFLGRDGARFEVPTLRRIAPLFLAYLVVLALWPFAAPRAEWRGEWLLTQIGHPPEVVEIARLLEWMAAFTLAGYVAAESLGRDEPRTLPRTARALLRVVPLAAALEALRGWSPDTQASALRFGVAALGGAFGAGVYGLQLDAVRAWVRERRRGTPGMDPSLPLPSMPELAPAREHASQT